MPSITTNEYIHEDWSETLEDGRVMVFYEPVDNPAILSLQGTIYIDGKETNPFSASNDRVVANWMALPEDSPFPLALRGKMYPDQGILCLLWNKHPGDHFLCVSYDFEEVKEEVGVKTNWIKEGF
jgi:hypothetical protein